MRVVVVTNAFRGGPSAQRIADELAAGVRAEQPEAIVETYALSDGGDGAIAVAASLGGRRCLRQSVIGTTGTPMQARVHFLEEDVALVATSEASGLGLVPPSSRDPMAATTKGTGELILAALDAGSRNLLLAAGGSATTDFGAGALAALGAEFRDGGDRLLDPRPLGLDDVRSISLDRLDPRLRSTRITVLSDVRTPLVDNLDTFGGQKGFTPSQRGRVAAQLIAMERAFGFDGGSLLRRPWLGAGGGMAAGFAAACEALVRSGADWFLARSGARAAISRADLVLTAEGCFDASSQAGKLAGVVAGRASRCGVPNTIIAATAKVGCAPGAAELIDLALPPREPGDRLEPALSAGLRTSAAAAVRRITGGTR
jgi:glycerate kinase